MRKFYLLLLIFSCPFLLQGADDFNKDKALGFLDRYAGRWVGSYILTNMNGELMQKLEAEIVYHWETDEKGPILKGRAVYGAEQGLMVAESETLIANKQIFSIIREGDKERTYRGRINEAGNGISWSPIDRDSALDEAFTEQFRTDANGKVSLISRAYENVVRNGIEILLTLQGTLHKQPLAEAITE